ncbi:MAG: right-handed parallel beta-helix repeat-containing protein, partial [Prevotellaceae bacterium]|nr:right-handed parallel beta-helix repeat-containing protein [Prevotellaceae bacterium]
MKKQLLCFLAGAALLMTGCTKDETVQSADYGTASVKFTATVSNNNQESKATYDQDGNGIYVTRCIMEIYFQDELYKRYIDPVSGTPGVATFANVPVVAGKEYKILFWADCGGEGLS